MVQNTLEKRVHSNARVDKQIVGKEVEFTYTAPVASLDLNGLNDLAKMYGKEADMFRSDFQNYVASGSTDRFSLAENLYFHIVDDDAKVTAKVHVDEVSKYTEKSVVDFGNKLFPSLRNYN